MNKFAAIILFLLLLGTNVFSMPQVFAECDIDAVECETQSRSDATQTENLPSAEVEERQEESVLLMQLGLFCSEKHTRYFLNYTDKTLIGALLDLVIPPNV
jgi:hypothetical protein